MGTAMAAGPTSNTWTMITSPRMFLAALLGSIMIILGLMIALSSSEVERHLTALRRSRPASVVLRSDESSTPLALVSMSSDESTRYERVRERFVASIEGIGGIDLRKEDVRTIVDQVMATVGSLLDSPGVLLPTDASQGGGSSTSPSEQSKHKNKKKKNPPPKEKEEQQQKKGPPNQNAKSTPIKYVYENHFPDRAYVNETFDFIPADVGTARLVANCSTVFERVKKRFAHRFGDAATARASLARPESPPLYPQPAGGDGGLLYLRHVHKTGGSSMRHIFHDFSDWTVSTYYPGIEDIERWTSRWVEYTSLYESAADVPKFLVEAHAGYTGDTKVQIKVHEMLNKVRNAYGARGWGDDCPISVVFVRDPLDFYISLYRWAVVGNQDQKAEFLSQAGYALNGKYVWGKDLLEWAPDNAMSRVMAGHMAFFDRRFFQLRWFQTEEGRFYDRGTGPAFRPGTWNFTQTKYEDLREALSGYDIVAPVSHVDYVMAMLQLLYGWDEPPFYHTVRPSRPNECRTCMSTETSEEICPDMAACRKRIEDVAPYDYKIFNEYSQRFKRQLEFLGDDFEEYVQAYKKEFAERKALVAEATFNKNAGWWLRDDRKVSNGSAGLSKMCKHRKKAEFADEDHPAYECLYALEERMRLASDPDSEDPLDPFWDEFRENVMDDLVASEGKLEDPAP